MRAFDRTLAALALPTACLMAAACTTVPGETTVSHAQQRAVRDRVLAMARADDPKCREVRLGTTEVLDVHPSGRSSEELWVVEQCGRRLRYVVSFPVKPGPPAQFSVRQER